MSLSTFRRFSIGVTMGFVKMTVSPTANAKCRPSVCPNELLPSSLRHRLQCAGLGESSFWRTLTSGASALGWVGCVPGGARARDGGRGRDRPAEGGVSGAREKRSRETLIPAAPSSLAAGSRSLFYRSLRRTSAGAMLEKGAARQHAVAVSARPRCPAVGETVVLRPPVAGFF